MTVAEATRDNFRELVAEGTKLVDVWGPQCKECIVLMPEVERIAEELELDLVKL
jgi:thioredoxin 1